MRFVFRCIIIIIPFEMCAFSWIAARDRELKERDATIQKLQTQLRKLSEELDVNKAEAQRVQQQLNDASAKHLLEVKQLDDQLRTHIRAWEDERWKSSESVSPVGDGGCVCSL